MSDIRINPIQNKTLLILKRIQSQLSKYRGYKEDSDLIVPSKIIYDEIIKRADISVSNLKAALDNLESYGKNDERKKGEELLSQIEELKNIKLQFPEKQIPVKKDDIEKRYEEDDIGFGNARELLDNVNSFRSASISGDYDQIVYEKISENIKKIREYLENRANIIKTSS